MRTLLLDLKCFAFGHQWMSYVRMMKEWADGCSSWCRYCTSCGKSRHWE